MNGGQTTALFLPPRTRRNIDTMSQISVQMKLNLIRSDKIDELVPKIAEFANTQISVIDLFSNHPFHQE